MPRKRAGAEVEALLREECARRWPGQVIPFEEGGRLFREISDRFDGVQEWKISGVARRLGLWPWNPNYTRAGETGDLG